MRRSVLWAPFSAANKPLPPQKTVDTQADSASQRKREQRNLEHELVGRDRCPIDESQNRG